MTDVMNQLRKGYRFQGSDGRLYDYLIQHEPFNHGSGWVVHDGLDRGSGSIIGGPYEKKLDAISFARSYRRSMS